MDEAIITLINQAKKGDNQAFGEIYRTYYERIYRFIYYMLYDPALAADITQTTFLKTWKSLKTFDSQKGTLQAFVFAVARNCVIDEQRKKKLLSLDRIEDLATKEDVAEELIIRENRKLLYKTMGFLKSAEKQLLVLRYFEEMSMAEIALVVGKDEGAVRVRIHRILKKMRAKLPKFTYDN
jgi:RNA polymerase sigma-70 factor, ECF subfamily